MKALKSVRSGSIIAVPLLAFSNSVWEKTPVQTPMAKAPPYSAAFMSFGYKPELSKQLGPGLWIRICRKSTAHLLPQILNNPDLAIGGTFFIYILMSPWIVIDPKKTMAIAADVNPWIVMG